MDELIQELKDGTQEQIAGALANFFTEVRSSFDLAYSFVIVFIFLVRQSIHIER